MWKNVVRIYNVSTGEWLRDLEMAPKDLISLEFASGNTKLLIGCCENGEIVIWKWKSGIREKRVQLQIPLTHVRQLTFNLVPNTDSDEEREAIVTFSERNEFKIGIFNVETGENLNRFTAKFKKLLYVNEDV